MWYIYTIEYYSEIKNYKNNAIHSNMNGPRNCHAEWSKSNRERQISYDITYMWNLKYDTNEPIYERETEQTGGCQRRELKEGCSGRLGLADVNYYI